MKDFVKRLTRVSKPVRYINNEINSIHKDVNSTDILKVCLSFPDLYEVGMSHLGIKILYESLNSSEKILSERFFMPWDDAIREFGKEIFVSLESKKSLREFDIVGFSLQYELSYTNLLFILKMSDIPLLSEKRIDTDPIIIAGGPTVYNPAPLSKVVDAFFIGEMDDKLREVLEELSGIKGYSRIDKLKFLNQFDFVYVPSLDKSKSVKRYIDMSFSTRGGLKRQIVPLMPITQDRVSVEISRGCTRGCRFCQAGMIYRPEREKSVGKIISEGINLIDCSGYKEISLMSLSASDYSKINKLMHELSEFVKDDKISLSLPSLRADQIDNFMFDALAKVRKSGFTIAPEAGSQRMRDIINKNLTEDDIFLAIEKAVLNGWTGAKLYFMVGLPFEKDEDILEIAELVKRLKRGLKGKGYIDLTVSVSNFVPKVFTPFQWFPQDSIEELKRKHSILKDALRRNKINFKFHDIRQSVMEGVFSRGDERLNHILIKAAEKGFMFDGWREFFDYEKWNNLFAESGFSVEDFSCRKFEKEDKLPWDNIDAHIKKEFLWKEYEKAMSEKGGTPDCKTSNCSNCGVCDFNNIKNINAEDDYSAKSIKNSVLKDTYYELIFEKQGFSSLMSAIEIGRIFHHSFEIIGIPLVYSNGFNPQPKINYIYPLPVGIEGLNEVIIFRSDEIDFEDGFKEKLNELLPSGIKVKKISKIGKYEQGEATVTYLLEEPDFRFLIDKYEKNECFYEKINRSGERKKLEIRDFLIGYDINLLTIDLKVDNNGGYNLLEFFKFWNYNYLNIVRTKIKLKGMSYV